MPITVTPFQLFTSLVNIVCGYDPAWILPYNHLLFADTREETVESALQVNACLHSNDLYYTRNYTWTNLYLTYTYYTWLPLP